MPRQSAITLESECTEAERAALIHVLATEGLTGTHMEIGTAAGGTLKEMVPASRTDGRDPHWIVVDPFTYYPDQFSKVQQNLSSAGIDPGSIEFWTGTTKTRLNPARDMGAQFDFIFIDGDHRALPVTIDLQWAEMVAEGGWIALHDNNAKFPGVGWAIDRFLEGNSDFRRMDQVDSLTLLKRVASTNGQTISRGDLIRARIWQDLRKWRRSIRRRVGGGA